MTPNLPRSNGRASVLVVGAGVVGTCCALWLRRFGFAVTLVDRNEPGSGCSAGNAGILHSGAVLPLATPGILRSVPRMLLDPNGPLVIRWRYSLSALPWLARFVSHATPTEVARISQALSALLSGALEATRALVTDAGAAHLLRNQGELYVFQGEPAQSQVATKIGVYRDHGVRVTEVDTTELRERVPVLSPAYTHGYYLPDSGFTIDPRGLTAALAKSFVEHGGTVRQCEVQTIERNESGGVVATAQGEQLSCDHLVIATGAFSKPLAKQAGVDVPLEALRGYHLMLPAQNVQLDGPLIDGAANFGAMPMAGGIRLAGTIEFAGIEAPPNWHRADMLLPMARKMLPTLDGSDAVRWMGHRPGLPDSMPMIGPVPHWPNVWCCFGHGTIGLTTAAASGKALAEAMAGLEPSVALAPFRVDRFPAA
jgi:glycine/D-amino acid oxidase-like deaminating enzyme